MTRITTLAIETSTAQGSVAISEGCGADTKIVFSETFTADRSHSAWLFVKLEHALTAIARCDQIVVGLGPGSYSGVRVAIAAAIGLRFGLKARLRGLNSLIAIPTAEPHYCCIGDARQSSFYFAEVKDRALIAPPALFSENELREKLANLANGEVQLRGQLRSQVQLGNEGKLAAKTALPIFAPTPILQFPEAQIAQPSAEILARLASDPENFTAETQRRRESDEGDANEMAVSGILEPIYLRPPHITLPKPIR